MKLEIAMHNRIMSFDSGMGLIDMVYECKVNKILVGFVQVVHAPINACFCSLPSMFSFL